MNSELCQCKIKKCIIKYCANLCVPSEFALRLIVTCAYRIPFLKVKKVSCFLFYLSYIIIAYPWYVDYKYGKVFMVSNLNSSSNWYMFLALIFDSLWHFLWVDNHFGDIDAFKFSLPYSYYVMKYATAGNWIILGWWFWTPSSNYFLVMVAVMKEVIIHLP